MDSSETGMNPVAMTEQPSERIFAELGIEKDLSNYRKNLPQFQIPWEKKMAIEKRVEISIFSFSM